MSSSPVCERVGKSLTGFTGVGIIGVFGLQALISLVVSFWIFFVSKLGRLDLNPPPNSPEHGVQRKRLELVSRFLMQGNNAQVLAGSALIVTAIVAGRDIGVYHLHLIYDIVSFVGISNCAATVAWTFMQTKEALTTTRSPGRRPKRPSRMSYLSRRHHGTYLFLTLFIALSILIQMRFEEWSEDNKEPGRCYIATGISSSPGSAPAADRIYIAITTAWFLSITFGALFGNAEMTNWILLISGLQFPVHLYMIIAIKIANRGRLEGPQPENGWDLGQSMAVLLLCATLADLVDKGYEYCTAGKSRRDSGSGKQMEKGEMLIPRKDRGASLTTRPAARSSQPRPLDLSEKQVRGSRPVQKIPERGRQGDRISVPRSAMKRPRPESEFF